MGGLARTAVCAARNANSNGLIYARASEGKDNYLYCMKDDGTERQKVTSTPVIFSGTVSPDGRWIISVVASGSEDHPLRVMAIPTAGGNPRPICDDCRPCWSADGRNFVITNTGLAVMTQQKTYVVPLRSGQAFPPLPPAGITSDKDLARLPGVRVIDRANLIVGADPATYAFSNFTVHRKLFRIPLP